MEKIKGLIDAPFSPMYPDGSINLSVIPEYAALLQRNGLKGVFINGSSGEGYMLTEDERKQIAEAWMAATKDFEDFKKGIAEEKLSAQKATAFKGLLKEAKVSDDWIDDIVKFTSLDDISLDDDGKIVDADKKSCKATVPDGQLSLAIGNKGQNARLAARLTGWKIDIRPESGFFGEEDEEEKAPAEDTKEAEPTEAEDTVYDEETAEAESEAETEAGDETPAE